MRRFIKDDSNFEFYNPPNMDKRRTKSCIKIPDNFNFGYIQQNLRNNFHHTKTDLATLDKILEENKNNGVDENLGLTVTRMKSIRQKIADFKKLIFFRKDIQEENLIDIRTSLDTLRIKSRPLRIVMARLRISLYNTIKFLNFFEEGFASLDPECPYESALSKFKLIVMTSPLPKEMNLSGETYNELEYRVNELVQRWTKTWKFYEMKKNLVKSLGEDPMEKEVACQMCVKSIITREIIEHSSTCLELRRAKNKIKDITNEVCDLNKKFLRVRNKAKFDSVVCKQKLDSLKLEHKRLNMEKNRMEMNSADLDRSYKELVKDQTLEISETSLPKFGSSNRMMQQTSDNTLKLEESVNLSEGGSHDDFLNFEKKMNDIKGRLISINNLSSFHSSHDDKTPVINKAPSLQFSPMKKTHKRPKMTLAKFEQYKITLDEASEENFNSSSSDSVNSDNKLQDPKIEVIKEEKGPSQIRLPDFSLSGGPPFLGLRRLASMEVSSRNNTFNMDKIKIQSKLMENTRAIKENEKKAKLLKYTTTILEVISQYSDFLIRNSFDFTIDIETKQSIEDIKELLDRDDLSSDCLEISKNLDFILEKIKLRKEMFSLIKKLELRLKSYGSSSETNKPKNELEVFMKLNQNLPRMSASFRVKKSVGKNEKEFASSQMSKAGSKKSMISRFLEKNSKDNKKKAGGKSSLFQKFAKMSQKKKNPDTCKQNLGSLDSNSQAIGSIDSISKPESPLDGAHKFISSRFLKDRVISSNKNITPDKKKPENNFGKIEINNLEKISGSRKSSPEKKSPKKQREESKSKPTGTFGSFASRAEKAVAYFKRRNTIMLENNFTTPRNSIGTMFKEDKLKPKKVPAKPIVEVPEAEITRFHKSDSELKIETNNDIFGNMVCFDDFHFIKILGEGAFGTVYLVKRKSTNDFYAFKIIKLPKDIKENFIKNIFNENEVFKKVNDKYVVTALFTFIHNNQYICFVMECMRGGDFRMLLEREGVLDEKQVRFYAAQLVLSVNYLHSLNIIHRDLKPDNMLLDSKGHLKLTDFGLSEIKQELAANNFRKDTKEMEIDLKLKKSKRKTSKQSGYLLQVNDIQNNLYAKSPNLLGRERTNKNLRNEDYLTLSREGPNLKILNNIAKTKKESMIRIVGTPDYIAPEILKGETIKDYSVDWWSVGCIIYELLVGITPFGDETVEKTFKNVKNLKMEWPPVGDKEGCISANAKDFITKFLVLDKNKRYGSNGLEEIKSHPFMKGINWDLIYDQKPPIYVSLTKLKKSSKEGKDISNILLEKKKEKVNFERSQKLKAIKIDQTRLDLLHSRNIKAYNDAKNSIEENRKKICNIDKMFKAIQNKGFQILEHDT